MGLDGAGSLHELPKPGFPPKVSVHHMPEKSVQQLPSTLRELHDRGMAAIQKSNFDYAVTLFNTLLKQDPTFYECREALRVAQSKRAGGRTSFLRKFVSSANSVTRGQLALRTNPREAIEIAEEILNEDPTNKDAHSLVADAAIALDLPRTAVLSLEVAFKANPRDRKLAEKLADTLTSTRQDARAEKILRDLLLAHPNDPVLNEKLKNVLASRTMTERGYEALADGSGSYRDILRDREEAVTLEQEKRAVKDPAVIVRLTADLEARTAAEPGNLTLLRQLASLHRQAGQFDRAVAVYEQILRTGGVNDPEILKAIAEAKLAGIDAAIEAIPAGADDAESRRAAMEQQRMEFLLGDARRRAELNPSDLGIRFELGDLLLRAGRVGEAIAELQKAQNHPPRRIAAMNLLAQCFARRGMNDLAAKKLSEALKEKILFDDEKKDLHYQIAGVLEKMGRRDESIEHLKTIYEQDIGYRDVMARVDAFYAGS